MARMKSIRTIETELRKAEEDLKKAQEKVDFTEGVAASTAEAGIRNQADHRSL